MGSCETACKTRKLVDDTETTIATKKDDFVAPSTYQFFYKKCTEAGCPLSGSEEIVQDCQCINEFAEAAADHAIPETGGKGPDLHERGEGRP